ncbi:MAG TPA: NRDE family protein [Gammaproteobacteria bacterium]
MCLLAIAWKTHPRYRLIFAGNRDEFHARPAAPANWWNDAAAVFAGRDLEAGGTWLGMRRDGRFAVVTNFREPDRRPAGKRSRGELTAHFLAGDTSPENYLAQLRRTADDYAGFNLLFGDVNAPGNQLFYFSNREGEEVPLSPGVHLLSNHLLNTPWPKVRRLRERFVGETEAAEPRIDALLEFLGDAIPASDAELPATGLSLDWERRLSAAKVVGPEYGTRASTVILVDERGKTDFHERRFTASGAIEQDTRVHFEDA